MLNQKHPRASKPLAIDLYCGLGGWAEGFLAEGYDVIGFDIERHDYGTGGYPGQLVLQDILTLHGSQFRHAAVIVASPPCQAYSYMAMPWDRAKREIRWQQWERDSPFGDFRLNDLFDACFRIQREASSATTICRECNGTGEVHQMITPIIRHWAMKQCPDCVKGRVPGRQIPLVVENVKGAQPWVGRAAWHYGSYYLWGDVPALMPFAGAAKVAGQDWSRYRRAGETSAHWRLEATKNAGGGTWFGKSHGAQLDQMESNGPRRLSDGVKQNGSGRIWFEVGIANLPSNCERRSAASAQIAKIPFELARHIARVYKPEACAVSAPPATRSAGQ